MSRLDRLYYAVWLFAFAVLAASSIKGSPQLAKGGSYDDVEGYTVLSVLLDRFGKASANSGIVIDPFTASEKQLLNGTNDRCARIPEEFGSAAADFRERSKVSLRFANKFSVKVKYELTDNPQSYLPPDPAPGEQSVDGRPFLRTLFKISAVGFDKTRTHAIAYLGAFCGDNCASGGLYLLENGKQEWKEVKGSPTCESMSRGGSAENTRGLS
jgi:hypothetical protein